MTCTQAQGSRLILIAIRHTEQLAELGLHEVTDLHFPPYTANQIRAVIESQLSGHDGVICPKAIKHLSKQVSYSCLCVSSSTAIAL